MAALGRLKTRPDFLRVAAASRKCVTPGLILQAAPAPSQGRATGKGVDRKDAGGPRVGFTASRKVGSAVERNRARRRLRAAAREVIGREAGSAAAADMDYVLIARRATLERPYAALLQDLETALKKVRTLPAGDKPRRAARH